METDNKLLLSNKYKKLEFKKQLLIYTVLFIVTALGVYLCFLWKGCSLLRGGETGSMDGIAQLLPCYVAIKHMFQDLIAGKGIDAWNWAIGLGADNFNMLGSKIANPLTYLIIIFPEKYMDIGYSLVTVFRQYLTGVAFMFFGRKVGLNQYQNIIGAMCYAFSGWAIMTAVKQGGFNNAMVLFPLLALGTEKILRKESPLLFVVSVFFTLTSGVIWAYVSGIVIVLYFFLRYACTQKEKSWSDFGKKAGQFFLNGTIGVLIGSAFVAAILYTMNDATQDTGSNSVHALFSLTHYLDLPLGFYKLTGVGAPSYGFIAMPILAVALLPMVVKKIKTKSTAAIAATALFVGMLFPIVSSVFNGFNAPSGRWHFVLTFFMVWAAMECLEEDTFISKKNCIVMSIWIILTAGISVVRFYKFHTLNKNSAFTSAFGLVFGVLIIWLCYLFIKEARKDSTRKIVPILGIMIIGVFLLDIGEIVNIKYYVNNQGGLDIYNKFGAAYEEFVTSNESAVPIIQERDKSFFRTDQVEGYDKYNIDGARANKNIFFGGRSIYTYFSTMSSKWHEFNYAVGNSYGNYRRTISNSNDNRAALDYLMGVKYYLGNTPRSVLAASKYVAYGYDKYDDINNVEVFKNNYCMGLGTTYTQYITESEFYKYPELEREQVLMQAAVVPDDSVENLNTVKHATKDDIKTSLKEIPYEIISHKNMQLDDKAKVITLTEEDCLDKKKGTFTIKIPEVNNCQLMLRFENLDRSGAEQSFLLSAVHGDIIEVAKCEKGESRGFNEVEDFNLNLGYYDSTSGEIEISLNKPGTYTYDSLKVLAMPIDIYANNAKILDSKKYEIDKWDGDNVSGTMTTDADGIMYFSILSNPGWHIYVDGEKAHKINDVNVSFTGAYIPKGTHQVELKYVYPYKTIVIIGTVIGIIALIIEIIMRKKNNESAC